MSSASSLLAAAPADPGAPLGTHPSMVLGAYLEPLVRGRRVAVLGDARIGLAERLVERGARLVHAYDPDAARAAEALARVSPGRQPHPSFAALEGDLGVRDGAFDVIVIPDLTLFPDAAEALRRARRLVSDGGAAVIASPNPDAARALIPGDVGDPGKGRGAARRAGPDYYALYDLVSLQFRAVRMLGQAPFVGYTMVDFAQDGDPEVSFDTSLLSGSEEPEWFIALAGERPVRLEPYSVVEIPFADLPREEAGGAPAEADAQRVALEMELADLRARLEREREHEEARADARAEAASATHARIAELEAELAERGARLLDVEARAKEIEARAKEVEARAGDAHVRAERNGHKIRDLEEELRSQRDRAARLAKQLDDEKKGRTKVELELGMIRNKPEIAGAKDRIDALGAELEGARARIAELEARPIVAPRTTPDPALMLRVEELEAAVTTARREIARISAERDGARGRVEELGRALEEQRRAADEQQKRAAEEQRRAADEQRRAAEEQRRAAEEQRRAEEQHQQRRAAAEEQRRAAEEQQRRAAEEQQRRAEEQQKRAAAEEQRRVIAALEARLAEAEGQRQGADQQKRSAEEQRRAAEEQQRRAAEEQQQRRAEEQQRRAAAEEQRRAIAAIEARLAEAERQRAALQRRNEELERQQAEAPRGDAGDLLAGEIAALEAALRERGHLVTTLQAELRESERVGKELVDELGHLFDASARDEGAAGGGPARQGPAGGERGPATARAEAAPGEGAEALRRQLDTLAQSTARYEADLHAAAWRIAQLERELSEALPSAEPARVHEELEEALAAAQAELAALRRAGAREPAPEVVEQAVLLHQVAGAAP